MSSVQLCLRFGKAVLENGLLYNPVAHRVASYSSYRSLWSNIINRKSAPAPVSSQESEKNNTQSSGSEEEDTAALRSKIDQLSKTVQELKEKNDEILDKYRRALADGENLRARMMKQIEEAKIFGIQNFCKDLLEVADVLSKATECVPKEELSDSNPHLKNLYQGLTMTETELKKVFSRHGLSIVNPIDEKFDPNMHEALFQQEVEGKAAGTVVVVSKIGYKLHDRIIRPALVGVAK